VLVPLWDVHWCSCCEPVAGVLGPEGPVWASRHQSESVEVLLLDWSTFGLSMLMGHPLTLDGGLVSA